MGSDAQREALTSSGARYDDLLSEVVQSLGESYKDASGIQPTEKSEVIEETIKDLCGKDRHETIMRARCMTCGNEEVYEDTFRDAISKKEYAISGMCQYCQDSCFGNG